MKPPTQAELLDRFILDQATGILTYRKTIRRCKAGLVAGVETHGYCFINVAKKRYPRSQLVFCMVYGRWANRVDHKNRIKLDDRPENLRECSQSENMANRTKFRSRGIGAGLPRGVYWNHAGGPSLMAMIRINGKTVYLGCFKTVEEAKAAYDAAAFVAFGDFIPNVKVG
jgi:hypothetical protein